METILNKEVMENVIHTKHIEERSAIVNLPYVHDSGETRTYINEYNVFLS